MIDFTQGATSSLSEPLTKALRAAAAAAGWDSMVVQQLSVIATDTGISVDYPESIADVVEDLEYGTIDRPPLPVFRTFLTKNQDMIGNSIEESVVDNLFDGGVFP